MAGPEHPLEALEMLLSFSSRDWAANETDAWLWGVVNGWDDASDDPPDLKLDAMSEVAARFHWNDLAVARLRRLHASFVALKSEPAGLVE